VDPLSAGNILGGMAGEVNFGLGAMHQGIGFDQLQLAWYDHWLKGVDNGVAAAPPVRIFVMGINQWRDEHEWPLARAGARERRAAEFAPRLLHRPVAHAPDRGAARQREVHSRPDPRPPTGFLP
jgi:predicted acyl esterase